MALRVLRARRTSTYGSRVADFASAPVGGNSAEGRYFRALPGGREKLGVGKPGVLGVVVAVDDEGRGYVRAVVEGDGTSVRDVRRIRGPLWRTGGYGLSLPEELAYWVLVPVGADEVGEAGWWRVERCASV
jgi:hypothetical protein